MRLNLWKNSHYIHAVIIISFTLSGCKQNSPSQPEQPKGIFVDKFVFTTSTPERGPLVTVADLYDDNGIFRLFNRKDLVEGLGPVFARNKSWVVYHFAGNNWEPMRINIDGTQNQKIPIQGNFVFDGVKISPDGAMLAFSFLNPDQYNGRHLGIVPITGGTIKTVYADPGWSITPEWSADGKKLYFAWADYYNRYEYNVPGSIRAKAYIISINLDGTGWRAISDTVSGLATDLYPSVSPDGNQIVFTSQRNFQDGIFPEIFITDINGTIMKQVTHCVGCQRHGDHFDAYTIDDKPLWTNDGKYIIFERQVWTYNHEVRDYAKEENIYIINTDGSSLQKLTDDGISSLTKKGTR